MRCDFFPNALQGFLFHSGGLGLRVCSLDVSQPSATVRNRPQPSATVRNRPQPSASIRKYPREGRMAVPMGSATKLVTFGGFRRRVASFPVAGVALCDISTCVL